MIFLASLLRGISFVPAVVHEDRFSSGLSKVIDGVVDCMNASVWAEAK
jgi:hypothetical protein